MNVSSILEVTEASEQLKKKALAECKLPDKSLKELLKQEGKAHENPTGDDARPSGSGNK